MKERGTEAENVRFSPEHLSELILMVEKKKITMANAKKVFEHIFDEDQDPASFVKKHNLGLVEDAGILNQVLDKVLEEIQNHFGSFLKERKK